MNSDRFEIFIIAMLALVAVETLRNLFGI